jgi:hypothetical protein
MRSDLPDGIYLDLSFEAYLAQRRVSSSDLVKVMESPAAYWANSHMNPDREEPEESEAMKLGRAYHAARLEPETFADLYCRELVPEDMPEGALLKDAEYKAALKELGEPQTKGSETVLQRAERLRDLIGKPNWHTARADWEEANADFTWLSPKHWGEIRRDATRLRQNPELAALISGGMAEVSILWTDEETGLKCKCRPDYLGANWITHLKTWDNKAAGKPGNRSIVDAFRFNGYYRTGWYYLDGLHAMPGLEFRHGTAADDNSGNNKPAGRVMKNPPESLKTWQTPKNWDTWFLFVRRSGIPDIRAREIMYLDLPPGVEEQVIGTDAAKFRRSASVLARKADLEVRRCLQQIAECAELYGQSGDPWYPRDMIGRIDDDDFSSHWLDSINEPR